jgi:aryl-alcohol dehydrogenase-like predicted oxidoreductase
MMSGRMGNSDHDELIRIIHKALDAGINFVDTADAYSLGESEEIVGKALKGCRDNIVLASKAHLPMSDDPNHRGNSRRWIISEVENSLRRLQTDHLDLHQVHRPDPTTDIDGLPLNSCRSTASPWEAGSRRGRSDAFASSALPR